MMMEKPSSSTTPKPHPSINDSADNSGFTLPKQLEDIKPATEFPTLRHRWNTNEEIASILIAFDKHKEWMHLEMKVRPTSGSMLLYSRKKVRYRKDGYCWKKRKDGKNIREDHMKLKVQGLECIYGSYVHSDILPTFHRRCYWLLQNPDIVIVHYLNVPYPDNTKMKIPVISQAFEKKEWTKEELVDQLRPMFSTGRPGEESEQMIEESVEALVRHLIEYHENCDKGKTHKCEKSCGKVCAHSNNIYKLSPRGTLADIEVATRKVADDTATCCAAKSSAQMSTVLAALKGPEKVQNTLPQGCTNVESKDSSMDSKSESAISAKNQASVGLTPVPYILSMGHLPTTSRYLVVGGQVNSMQSPITVSAGCHVQPISHLVTQQLPGNQMQSGSLQPVGQQPHQHLQSLTISMAPSTSPSSGVSGEVTQSNSQQNLISNQFIETRSDQSVVVPMQISGLEDNACMLVRKDINDLKQDALPHLQTVTTENAQNCQKVILSHADKLVPHLQTITAEDVQKMLQTSASLEEKDRCLGLENCKEESNNIETENTCLTSSLGSADYSFDNLDLLDFPDVEKLVNDLSTSESRGSFNTKEDMAGPLPLLNCANCLNNQRNHDSQDGKVRGEAPLAQIPCHQIQQAASEGQILCGPQGVSSICGRVGGDDKNHANAKMSLALSSSSDFLTLTTNGVVRTMASTGAVITDYCPEWSYTEGGGKMLITGSWLSATPNYTCVFDGKPVPTRLIQSGVLRCYIPAHVAGCVSLQVACDGTVISNSVPFEYKSKPEEDTTQHVTDWFEIDGHKLKLLLVDKLAELERRVNCNIAYCDASVSPLRQIQKFLLSGDLEENLVWHVKKMTGEAWSDMDSFPQAGPFNMTLLHLAAALGYSKLIQTLIQWRSDNPCWVLEYEVDARCQDDSLCTPLMWACAKGHTQAAIVLYHWNSEALNIQNREQLSPLLVARKRGHIRLIQSLEKLECIKSGNIMFTETQGFIHCDPIQSPTKSMGMPLQASTPLSKELPGDNPFKSPPPPNVTLQRGVHNIDISACSSTSYTGTGPYLVRRQSDQTLNGNSARQKLSKRFSVDLCPGDGNQADISDACENRPIREANSEPQLSMAADHMTRRTNPMLSDPGRDLTSPDILMQAEVFEAAKLEVANMEAMSSAGTPQPNCSGLIHMDTDEVLSSGSGSPIIDVEKLSSEDDDDLMHRSSESTEDVKHQMVTLAKQIIAAMPERIKSSPGRGDNIVQEFTHVRERSGSYSSIQSQPSPHASSYEEDSGISTPMGEGLNFDEYRYTDLGTPASSLSPDSTCLPSPYSPYSFTLDSPPPTTAEFTEYFNAPATFMEKDFSQLTLSDQEQRKLYEAAKVIQNAFRQYRDKQQLQQQQKEIEAAVLIQKYYRRYKQYAYYKKMTQAAVLIQSQFRSYYAQKRFKKSRDAAVVIQNQYRTYKEHERLKKGGNKSVIIQQRFRSHYQRKSSDGPVPEGHIVQLVPEAGDSSQADPSNIHSDSTQLPADDESYHSQSPESEQDEQSADLPKKAE